MAKKRDVIIASIIIVSFVVVIMFFGLAFVGMLSPEGDGGFVGLGNSVGLIEVFGVMDETSGRPVVRQLYSWAENNSISAVVIHVNSPGGQVSISQEIYDAILYVRDEKPVVVSMAAVAASGGYYIACAADRVVANPGTLTGSIGTIFSFYTFETLFDKIGMSSETIKSGEFKDVGNPARPMTKKEELMLQSVVMDGYEQFVEVVAEGRGLERDEVYTLADGSVYTGSQAYNLGLVDTLGGLVEAIDIAADLAGLDSHPNVTRPRKRETYGWGNLFSGMLGKLVEQVTPAAEEPGLLYLYRR